MNFLFASLLLGGFKELFMTRYFYFFIFFFAGISLSAQTVPRDSVRWELDTDGNEMTLRYKMTGVKKNRPYLGVFVDAKGEAGVLPILIAEGDIGNGVDNDESKEKVITFDPVENHLEDLGKLQFKFDVVSFPAKYAERGDALLAPVRQIPYLAAAAVGAGLGIFSIPLFKDSRELYDVYLSDLNPYSTVFAETSREDYYTKANKKYLNAQIMATTGSALFLGGAALWIDFKMKRSDWEKMKRWSLGPSVGFGEFPGATLSVSLQKK